MEQQQLIGFTSTTSKPHVDKKLLEAAIKYMLVNNLSIRQCAQLFQIPKSTLHRNLQKRDVKSVESNNLILIEQLKMLL
ncbi:DNA_binding HTH domain [Hexamita inflata]|uniref:Psq-type n=1 Tax=Hexamita inflata TaxID=28002 RepID=A0AA86NFM1_9EUKA|nr:DNA binding HTH domain [Hexamita inflata]CAI9918255.1 DNA binding HTH domain [Hexamita inflata]